MATASSSPHAPDGVNVEAVGVSFPERSAQPREVIALIEDRSFIRHCLCNSFQSMLAGRIVPFSTLADFAEEADAIGVGLAIFCRLGRQASDLEYAESTILRQLSSRYPMVVLSDVENPKFVMAALDAGFRGYLSTALSLEHCVDALKLVRSGGTFIPANCLKTALNDDRIKSRSMFTAKQAAVVEALRRGKANKIIAYELNMCESTVKVHIRNIMKKLRAKNRTEVAYLANDMENREKF